MGTFDEAAGLRRFYAATSEAQARELLDALLSHAVRPVVERVVRRRLEGLGLDTEDVAQEAVLRVAGSLLDGRRAETAIHDLAAYAARVAEHACDETFRRRFRLRYNVTKRVLVQLRRNAAFYPWSAPSGLQGALREWPPPPPAPLSDRVGSLVVDTRRAAETILRGYPWKGPKPPRTAHCLKAALLWCAGALSVDALVRLVQTARNEFDEAPALLDERLPAPTEPEGDDRAYLAAVWAAIETLRPNQAAALLLNLRFDDGLGPETFEMLGVADLAAVATVLRMEPGHFERDVLPTLPWPDRHIAEHLGCTVLQVSGLRSTARRTLAHRLAAGEDAR